jgi:hypothetical protein
MRRIAIALLGLALLAGGCATAGPRAPAAADLSGEWTGLWRGYGIDHIRRQATVTAVLHQAGDTGSGVLVLNDTAAVSALPLAVRQPGMAGVRVVFDVSGSQVVMAHELGGNSQLQCATFSHRFSDKMRHLLRGPGAFSVRALR